jgi:hypothetical protein
MWVVSALLAAGLAACTTSGDRLSDMDVRTTDRADCRNLRGNSAEVRADPSVTENARRACEEAAVLWRSQGTSRESAPVDFRRDRGD